jgi:hypothetical protein
MAKAPAKKPDGKPDGIEIQIESVEVASATFHIVGETPLLMNSLSAKAKRELLLPKGRKTGADKIANLKHDPRVEFFDATYRMPSHDGLTALGMSAAAFKASLSEVALRVPGAKKTEIAQLCWVGGAMGMRIPVWGVPMLHMSAVRSADMARTPDIRTRAMLHEWATIVTLKFATPQLTGLTVAKLLSAAGLLMGVGDFRQQKGAGNYGQFRIVSPDDPTFQRIQANGGRAVQIEALKNPQPADDESAELFDWFEHEVVGRGMEKTRDKGREVMNAALETLAA